MAGSDVPGRHDPFMVRRLTERLRPVADRLKTTFVVRVILKYAEDDGPNWATLIAWNAFSALLPITLALASLVGFVLSGSGVREESVSRLVLQILPSDLNAQGQAIAAIKGLEDRSGIFALLAILGFLWIASNLFGAMEAAFDQALRCPRRGVLRQKAMSLLLMAAFMLFTLIGVGSSALLSLLPMLPEASSLSQGPVAPVVQFVVGAAAGVLLFSILYRVVPNTELSFRTVLPGALMAGVTFEVLSLLLPLYLDVNRSINEYGKTFALIFFLFFFFFLLGTITMIGVEINSVVLERSPRERAPGSALASATRDTNAERASAANVSASERSKESEPMSRRTTIVSSRTYRGEEVTSTTPDFREWIGKEVRDQAGEKVGTLEEVYYDSETDDAMFLLLKSGFFGRHLTFVPVAATQPGRTYLQIDASGETIKQAPTIESGTDLEVEDEERIYRYYESEYRPARSGRRLVRR